MMNGKEFAKAQASIMNKKTKLVQLKDDRAEACKKINEIEQEIAKTENELLEEENKGTQKRFHHFDTDIAHSLDL